MPGLACSSRAEGLEPDAGADQVDSAFEHLGQLVVARCDASPALEFLVAPLDQVAAFVLLRVEADRAATLAALAAAVGLVVGLFRDHGFDLPPAQVGSVLAGAVGHVGGDRSRTRAGLPTSRALDLDALEDRDELRTVSVLAGGDDGREGAGLSVARVVDLAGQSAAGPAELGGAGSRLASSGPLSSPARALRRSRICGISLAGTGSR